MSLHSRKQDISTCRRRYWVIWCCTWRLSVLYWTSLTDGQSPWWWWTGFHTPEQRSTSSAQQSRAFVIMSFKCSCESRRVNPASLSWTFIVHPTDHSRRSMTSFKTSYQTTSSSHMRRFRRASCRRLLDQSGIGWCARDTRFGTTCQVTDPERSGLFTRSHHHGSTFEYSRFAGHRLKIGVGSPTHPCSSRHHLIGRLRIPTSSSHHCSPHQPKTRIHSQIRSALRYINTCVEHSQITREI